MKVDKYDISAESGASIWVLVEHGTDIETFSMPDGYAIKAFVETFELNKDCDLNYEQAMDRMQVKGCYYGTTTFNGCSIK